MSSIRLTREIEALAVGSLPFIVWLVLWIASRHWAIRQHQTVALIRTARLLALVLAVVFWLTHESYQSFPTLYGAGCVMFSAGLTFPERWVQGGIAPS